MYKKIRSKRTLRFITLVYGMVKEKRKTIGVTAKRALSFMDSIREESRST